MTAVATLASMTPLATLTAFAPLAVFATVAASVIAAGRTDLDVGHNENVTRMCV